jgi:predicted PurR-regulated permease PerM
MSDDYRRAHRAALATRTLIVVSVMLLAAILYTVITVAEDTNETVTQVRATQVDARSTLSLIESCTTPNGACTQAGNARTAAAIAEIVTSQQALHRATRRYAAVAATCADQPGPQSTRQIAACIRKVIR